MASFQRARSDEKTDTLSEVKTEALEPVSEAMLSGEGFRLETVGLVLETIGAWELTPGVAVVATTTEELSRICLESRARPTTPEEVGAAIRALTLDRERLTGAEQLEHWEQERRTFRLMTRPIVRAEDGSLRLLPWQSRMTWHLFQGYLAEGRCIWPNAGLSETLREALEQFRAERNRELERSVAEQFRHVTPLLKTNVKKPRVLGLTELYGEVDLVAVDQGRRIIWVVEAKDLFIPFSASALRSSYQKFFEKPNYVGKLVKKVASIEAKPTAVAVALGAADPDGPRRVRPLMATRRIEPASFVREASPVPFCPVSELVDFVSR